MTTVTQADITRAFKEAGVVPGDTVMFHSSLKSMGHVEGGPLAVIDGILDAAAPGGTVAAPSFYYNGSLEECPIEKFDVNTSPTYLGTIPETLRQDPRSVRSNNFSHSVNAIGARAVELTENHGGGRLYPSPWNEQAFAEISPWSKFYQWNALYCFIGVDMNTCSMKHYIESRFVAELLDKLPPERYMEFRSQIAMNCSSTFWIFYPGAKMREKLVEKGMVKHDRIGDATLLSIRTRPLVEAVLDILRAAPQDWCTPEFYQWICSVKAASGQDN